MSLVTGLLCVLMTPTACGGAVGSPSANPDHGAPAPANGGLRGNPVRPNGMPKDFLEFSWHVAVYDDHHAVRDNPAIARITASSKAPIQGNVHGQYPLRIYTRTPYTHTIWTQPGIQVQTQLTATADPPLPEGWYMECSGTTGGHLVGVNDFTNNPAICIMSHLIQG